MSSSPSTSRLASLIDWICSSVFGMEDRTGSFRCHCGKVHGKFVIPPSSRLVDQNHARCHCPDCVDFVESLPHGKEFVDNYSTYMINFYKSDIQGIGSNKSVAAVKQHPDSILLRVFCVDCGTPIGAEFPETPFVTLHPEVIQEDGPIYMPPTILFCKYAPKEARPWVGLRHYQGLWGVHFFLRIAGRVFLGFLFGKHRKGGFLNLQYENIPQGREQVSKLLKTTERPKTQ